MRKRQTVPNPLAITYVNVTNTDVGVVKFEISTVVDVQNDDVLASVAEKQLKSTVKYRPLKCTQMRTLVGLS